MTQMPMYFDDNRTDPPSPQTHLQTQKIARKEDMREHKQKQKDVGTAWDVGDDRRYRRAPRGGGGGSFGSAQNRRSYFFDRAVQHESRRQIEAGVWC